MVKTIEEHWRIVQENMDAIGKIIDGMKQKDYLVIGESGHGQTHFGGPVVKAYKFKKFDRR